MDITYEDCSNETRLGIVLCERVEATKIVPMGTEARHATDMTANRSPPQRTSCIAAGFLKGG
jgi:hypothetical protein